MSKRSTKIICVTASVIAVLGMAVASGCSGYFSSNGLEGDYTVTGKAESNGGFAVGTDNYVYFINGVESNTANNAYGTPVKGAVYRISRQNLNANNYSSAEKVVPLVAYTSNYDAGIFIYGDRIYYGTPSTAKNSEGEVQSSTLDMKSSKLDGTETMRDAYISFPVTSYDYRYVEENGVVYLMYAATGETLYDESEGVTNLHSYNTVTGEDTLLAYNVSNVTFDANDKTNPRVYYTMGVYDYTTDSNYGYNQLYTVTASATENNFADLSSETVSGWDDETDRYINCGELVLDGIGKTLNETTPFNKDDKKNDFDYTYTPAKYVNKTLFYTRKGDTSREYLFSLKDGEELHPVDGNEDKDNRILTDGSNAAKYEYIFDNNGSLSAVLYAESAGISINKADPATGKLHVADDLDGSDEYFKIVQSGTATLLTVDAENNWLYYSVSGGNGYSINRVDYSGTLKDYKPMPADETDKTPVKILDLDADSSWYKPEFIAGHLLFASETTNMTAYNYVMAFKLEGLTNGDIRALNEKYEGITKHINETYGDTDKYPESTYANLKNALNYAFYSGDYDYLLELAEAANAKVESGEDLVYSEKTLEEYAKFLNPAMEGNDVWAEYADVKKVNGKDVYANTRDYYYAVLGEMTEADAEAYMDGLKSSYLVAYPEDEATGWYEGLSQGEQIGFIIGMVAIGLLVIAGATVLTVFLIKRSKKNANAPVRRRIKVDTTDDKDIDVYSEE
ncbi:MAG: hypothetical protein K2N30_05920 [Clostridia bacterium]|nr:hypothetical protein [Clostridia bacterium]